MQKAHFKARGLSKTVFVSISLRKILQLFYFTENQNLTDLPGNDFYVFCIEDCSTRFIHFLTCDNNIQYSTLRISTIIHKIFQTL